MRPSDGGRTDTGRTSARRGTHGHRFRQLPEGSRLTLGVIAANVAVFAAWRVPALHVFMRRNFVHPENGKRLRTILTAGFSHMGGFHLLANMYGLYLFMPLAASVLGAPETLFVYTSGASAFRFPLPP